MAATEHVNDYRISHVSDTALWVAAYRALEGERADALFKDPLASVLAGEKGLQIAKRSTATRYTKWSVVIRTWIVDGYVRKLASEGVDTVLNLGAGLDTRPYRLDLPASLRWIEVDFPHMIDFKEEKLRNEKPGVKLERVKLDLSDRGARQKLFGEISKSSKKVLVITEGVIPYLTNQDVSELAEDLRAAESFRFWTVEYFSAHVIKYFHSSKMKKLLKGAPMKLQPEDWFPFFERRGWKERETLYLPEVSRRLGRAMPSPWWAKLLWMITPEEKRKTYRRLSGYILLEPN